MAESHGPSYGRVNQFDLCLDPHGCPPEPHSLMGFRLLWSTLAFLSLGLLLMWGYVTSRKFRALSVRARSGAVQAVSIVCNSGEATRSASAGIKARDLAASRARRRKLYLTLLKSFPAQAFILNAVRFPLRLARAVGGFPYFGESRWVLALWALEYTILWAGIIPYYQWRTIKVALSRTTREHRDVLLGRIKTLYQASGCALMTQAVVIACLLGRVAAFPLTVVFMCSIIYHAVQDLVVISIIARQFKQIRAATASPTNTNVLQMLEKVGKQSTKDVCGGLLVLIVFASVPFLAHHVHWMLIFHECTTLIMLEFRLGRIDLLSAVAAGRSRPVADIEAGPAEDQPRGWSLSTLRTRLSSSIRLSASILPAPSPLVPAVAAPVVPTAQHISDAKSSSRRPANPN